MSANVHRTVVTVTILSNGPYEPTSLAQIDYDITQGEHSGVWSVTQSEKLTDEQAARELEKQGSDPEFLLGDDRPAI